MRVLAIDCASTSASVALLDDETVLGESFNNVKLTHSQTLLPMVEDVFSHTQTSMQSIDAIAVTVGPGSFTGVRIGVAAVKGMADALHIPCYAISSLEAAAFPFKDFDGTICAVMDARRDQVYTASFQNGVQILEDAAMSVDELQAKLQPHLEKPILLVGDGAVKVKSAFENAEGNFRLSHPQFRYVHASSVAYLAKQKQEHGDVGVESKQLMPLYLRLPQAQRELNNKLKKN